MRHPYKRGRPGDNRARIEVLLRLLIDGVGPVDGGVDPVNANAADDTSVGGGGDANVIRQREGIGRDLDGPVEGVMVSAGVVAARVDDVVIVPEAGTST